MRRAPGPRCDARAGALLVAIVVAQLATAAVAVGADTARPVWTYVPGRGLQVGATGLSLGGYLDAEVAKPEGRRVTFRLGALALLGDWELAPRWRLFSETELEDALVVDDRGHARSGEDVVRVERLHVDYLWSDALAVRVGKFLTPIGIWNPVHAAPLVWTVSRPVATTSAFFDEFVTGIMLSGTLPAVGLHLGYSVWGQPTDQLAAEGDAARSARRGSGARLQLSQDRSWVVGLSSLALDNDVLRRWESVSAADFRWEGDRLELWSEIVSNTPVHGDRRTSWACYLQATVPLVAGFHAVGRYEHVHDADVDIGVVGIAYRPRPYLVVKAEYLFSDGRSFVAPDSEDVERGFAAAVAFFF